MNKIDELFQVMVQHGASDLHLHSGQPAKIRIHGDVQSISEKIISYDEMVLLLSEISGPERWKQFLQKGDLDFAYQMDVHSRFRSNFMKHLHGIGAVFRLIPTKILTLDELGVPAVLKSLTRIRGGLVVVTGPTGSGKSTTLAAMVDFINSHYSKHIVTIEEPIEFVHANRRSVITQREVGMDCPSFEAGLRAALREDADIILVGEMRDLETIALALSAAETGLLVFGTLHTNNARKTVDRLIDAFPADQQPQIRTMLSSSLRGVVAQLLMKKADGKGRLAVNEILIANAAVSSIIREGRTEKLLEVIVGGRSEGMQLMDDSIMKNLKEGVVSGLDAYMKAIDKEKFESFLPPGTLPARS
jgi:twitching motility protein PilT